MNQEYLFSTIRCVSFVKYFLLYLLILTLSPTLNLGLDDNCSISPYRLKYTVLSFFFLLASTGVILMELCLVLLYWLSIFGDVKKFGITLDSKFLPHLGFNCTVPSFTLDFSSFSVEYSVMPFFSNSSFTKEDIIQKMVKY